MSHYPLKGSRIEVHEHPRHRNRDRRKYNIVVDESLYNQMRAGENWHKVDRIDRWKLQYQIEEHEEPDSSWELQRGEGIELRGSGDSEKPQRSGWTSHSIEVASDLQVRIVDPEFSKSRLYLDESLQERLNGIQGFEDSLKSDRIPDCANGSFFFGLVLDRIESILGQLEAQGSSLNHWLEKLNKRGAPEDATGDEDLVEEKRTWSRDLEAHFARCRRLWNQQAFEYFWEPNGADFMVPRIGELLEFMKPIPAKRKEIINLIEDLEHLLPESSVITLAQWKEVKRLGKLPSFNGPYDANQLLADALEIQSVMESILPRWKKRDDGRFVIAYIATDTQFTAAEADSHCTP